MDDEDDRSETDTGRTTERRGFHPDRVADRDVGDADPDDAGRSATAEAEEAGEPDLGDSVGENHWTGGATVQLRVSFPGIFLLAGDAGRRSQVGRSLARGSSIDHARSGDGTQGRVYLRDHELLESDH